MGGACVEVVLGIIRTYFRAAGSGFQHVGQDERPHVRVQAQPEPGILVELSSALGGVFGNLRFDEALVARGLGRRGRGVDDGLDDAARAEDGRRA